MSKTNKPAGCPCGGPSLAACCGPYLDGYLDGAVLPATAELLMRSRYTAYTLQNEPYLLATWYPRTRPTERIVDPAEPVHWLGLEVKSALRLRQRKVTGPDEAYVEFVARFRIGGKGQRLHEISRFLREPDPALGGQPRWFYVDGDFPTKD
ncbi:SEC-C motif-containing protein [Pseudoduganella lurida]|uniref:SEC-C motif-containing protein n=1 Tax=Pseudoduganella lurida TaxID=1036180 RepID=A0A562QZ40_9BURK|nr:YchJ family metal-binding protein [Pseudoduganella lurida]TWI61843.1 SEC-C motif-containing protein [Pseudoduganella lurida]